MIHFQQCTRGPPQGDPTFSSFKVFWVCKLAQKSVFDSAQTFVHLFQNFSAFTDQVTFSQISYLFHFQELQDQLANVIGLCESNNSYYCFHPKVCLWEPHSPCPWWLMLTLCPYHSRINYSPCIQVSQFSDHSAHCKICSTTKSDHRAYKSIPHRCDESCISGPSQCG